ncbi:LOW QUALITY PROTEIN: hypothetical protein PSENEW3n2_00002172 [Picochlorum sp. SENEW3]|nr:LOW QUALITY PROTEIN: hypothetical protein PSENEW3n2_00002172 [Picochlorum sp. SENEW3]WPT15808.1 LOW QUALITY PROTEIN: hypothetical protein PSENEW3_00002172 [Picochlorum sp. SENEW3]
MAGKEVIRAVQVFSKEGMGSKVSVVKDIVIGSFLGVSLGLTYHWKENERWESFYTSGSSGKAEE